MAQGVGLGTHRCQLELETVPSAVCSTADLVRPRVAQRRHWAPTAQSRHWPRLRPLGTRPANIHQPVCSARRAGFPASSVLECTPTGRESFPARVAFPPAPALGTLGARRCRRHRPLGPRPEDIYRPAFLARRADVRAASLFLARRAGVRTASLAFTHDEWRTTSRVWCRAHDAWRTTSRVFPGVLDPVCSPCSDLRGELPGVMPPCRKSFLPIVASPGRADTGVSGPLLHSAAISCGRERGRGRAPASPRQSRPRSSCPRLAGHSPV